MIVIANKSKRLIGLVAKNDEIGEDLTIVNLKPGYNKVEDEDWEKVKDLPFTQRQLEADIIFVIEKSEKKVEKKKTKKKKSKKSDIEI